MNQPADEQVDAAASQREGAEGRPRGRPGRRTGPSVTRERVLSVARARFAARGYTATTIRDVAADAGVDPALVHYFFGTKDGLFAAAMALPVNPAVVLRGVVADGPEGLGERLVRAFLGVWDDPVSGPALVALVRSAVTHEGAAEVVRGFMGNEVVARIASVLGRPDATLRASLAASQLLGLAVARYIVRVEPLASADHDSIVASMAPALQSHFTGGLEEQHR